MARGRRYASGPKRQVTWIGSADQNTVAVATGASAIVASFAPDSVPFNKPTIVRTRGEIGVRPESAGADLGVSGAFGVCVVNSDAFAAGAASIPAPFDDAGWDGWFVWQSVARHVEFVDGTGFEINAMWNWQVDSKAMRKVGDNETIVLMYQSQVGAVQVAMHLRMLIKLS